MFAAHVANNGIAIYDACVRSPDVPTFMQRPAACDRGLGERHLISAQPSEDACSHRGALVVAAGSTRRRGGGRGDGEKLLGVSLPVLRCLHRALHGLCAAMPEVYAASMYWTGMDSRRSRLTPADEQVCCCCSTVLQTCGGSVGLSLVLDSSVVHQSSCFRVLHGYFASWRQLANKCRILVCLLLAWKRMCLQRLI